MSTQTMPMPFPGLAGTPQTPHWKTVDRHLRTLPLQGSFFVISTPDQFSGEQPQVSEVVRMLCAELLAGGKHRLATEPEIAAWRAAQKERADQYALEELRRKESKVVVVTQSQAEQIGVAPPKKGKD